MGDRRGIDPDFAIEYIDEIYKLDKRPTRYSDTRDYSFLWKRDNSVQLMTRVIERIYYNEQKQISLRSTYPAVLFGIGEEGQHNPATREKQDEFLNDVIKHRFEILDFMRFVFALIAQFVPERKRQFVKVFLQHNKRFEDFQALPLEPHVSSWSGSAVPTLQGQAEYLESLLPFLNSVELLQHRQYIEQTIQRIRSEIEWEKKRDFMGD